MGARKEPERRQEQLRDKEQESRAEGTRERRGKGEEWKAREEGEALKRRVRSKAGKKRLVPTLEPGSLPGSQPGPSTCPGSWAWGPTRKPLFCWCLKSTPIPTHAFHLAAQSLGLFVWKDLCQDLSDDPVVKILGAGGLGSMPGQGTRFSMPQLKSLQVATKTQCSQIKNKLKKKSLCQLKGQWRLREATRI